MSYPREPDQDPPPDGTANGHRVPDASTPGEVVCFPRPRPTEKRQDPDEADQRAADDQERPGQPATSALPDPAPEPIADEDAPVPVDPKPLPGPGLLARLRTGDRRPVLPAWSRSWEEFRDALAWLLGHYGHTAAFHAVRVPVYASRLVLRAPAGAGKLLNGATRWVYDAEGIPVRAAVVRREDAELYLKLSRQRDIRVRARTIAAGITVPLLVAATVATLLAEPLIKWTVLLSVLVTLGVIGSPRDKPLVGRAVVTTRLRELTSDEVVQALSVIGLAGINQALSKNPHAIGFAAPITRDGPGWRADINLPPGVTVGEVADRRDKLASGLGRPLGCVWPEGNAEVHPGRLILWVGDEDMNKTRQPAWPLVKSGSVDLFKPFPFGTDQRGRVVTVTLMFVSMVIGSVPRMGKTFAIRLALLAAALDVRTALYLFELKGTGDLGPLEPVAHRYRSGAEDEDVAYGLAVMREVRAELTRRSKVIRGLPREICPENKVTPELASRKSLRLHPIVVAVDECQKWFEHRLYGKELEELCDDAVRLGPALGITTIFGTQRPDARSLPTGISANAILRFCLKVMGHTENDMVLGTGAHRNGIRATMFSRRDFGIGYLAGEGDDPVIIRTFKLDGVAAEKVVARARAMRERAGALSGHALGQDQAATTAVAVSLLADIAAVVPAGEERVWSEVVVARLAELRPEVYGGWTAKHLAAALEPLGVDTGQVWATDPATGRGTNRKGITRAHITDKLAQRN